LTALFGFSVAHLHVKAIREMVSQIGEPRILGIRFRIYSKVEQIIRRRENG